MTFIIFFPLYTALSSSLKENNTEFLSDPLGLPKKFDFHNYVEVFIENKIYLNFLSSFIISGTSICLILVVSSLAAYALAKYKLRFNKSFYLMFLIGIFLPIRMGTINVVRIVMELTLYNNFMGLILIESAIGIPLSIFILTGFIKLIPEELSNSARIDGCSEPGIFIKIIVPLLKPVIVTIVLFNLLRIWNDFWFPFILIKSDHLKPVPHIVVKYVGEYMLEYPKILVVLNIAAWPTIILYLILSRHYIRGITGGALKE